MTTVWPIRRDRGRIWTGPRRVSEVEVGADRLGSTPRDLLR